MAQLEHVNLTVSNIPATARMLEAVFGWKIRWEGDSIHDGHTAHVGATDTYVALYTNTGLSNGGDTYHTRAALNHIGVVVDDLDATEQRVKDHGLIPKSHADYEPGRRFYFDDADGVEWEVISYA